jgi:hypothetical protein
MLCSGNMRFLLSPVAKLGEKVFATKFFGGAK